VPPSLPPSLFPEESSFTENQTLTGEPVVVICAHHGQLYLILIISPCGRCYYSLPGAETEPKAWGLWVYLSGRVLVQYVKAIFKPQSHQKK
jgi:hypothetical protein